MDLDRYDDSLESRSASYLSLITKFITSFFVVAKGQSANMLKISSKRRRTLTQIKADKEAAAQKEAENEARIQQVHELQQRLMEMEREH